MALIDDCVKAWLWCSEPKNLEAVSEGDVCDGRMPTFRINKLHKACFNTLERSAVDAILTYLQAADVVGPEFEGQSSGGRKPDMRSVGAQWKCIDNDEASAIQEVRLREKLMRAVAAPAATPQPARMAVTPLAVTPLRMLAETTISMPDGAGTVRLQAGSIVSDPRICKLLRDCPPGTQPIADGGDQDTCWCKWCQRTFKRSEAKPPFVPLIATGDFRAVFHFDRDNKVKVPVSKRRDELIVEPMIVAAIKQDGSLPCVEADACEFGWCPRCQQFIRSASVLGDKSVLANAV